MKTWLLATLLLPLLLALLLMEGKPAGGGQSPKARPPAVAGSFYPADARELSKMIDGYLIKAAPPPAGNPIAIIAPHAGYIYSGSVAAYSYALLKGRKYDRVVVVAPSHYEAFDFASVYNGTAYKTPLGEIPVDQAFAARLAKMDPLIKLSSRGHTPTADRPEHALEVQLPFLQHVVGSFQLVPIILGDQSYDTCRALGVALAKLIQSNPGSTTLIVASSDLSHYHSYEQAVSIDHKTLKAITEYDYFDLSRNLESRVREACGGGPVVAVMIAAERLGANEARLLHYANTGDVTGDHSRVVGYGAVALLNTAGGAAQEETFSLTQPAKDALLEIARKSVESAVSDRKTYACRTTGIEALDQERGAFVTLTINGRLRGCIGYVAPLQPLYLTVRDVARLAALKDSRFLPVTTSELASLEYEISVLSPLRRVHDAEEICIGEHGLLIHKDGREGLLLPQVAAEQKWDRNTFLEQVCYKAGLPPHAWKDADADLFRFTALVFGERPPALSLLRRLPAWPPTWPPPPQPGPPAPRASSF